MENAKSSIGLTTSSSRDKYECKTCFKKFSKGKMLPGFMFCSTSCLMKYSGPNSLKPKIKKIHLLGSYPKPSKPKKTKKKEVQLSNRTCVQCSSPIAIDRCSSKFCSRRCKRIYSNNKTQWIPTKNLKPLVRIDLWSDENKVKWQRLRYEAFKRHGRKCAVCGATDKLHVDHIKPKAVHPELCWSIDNLQILCEDCNIGKGYHDETDWRVKS